MKWSGRLKRLALMLMCSMISMTASAQGGAPGFGYPDNATLKADNRSHYACWNDTLPWPQELVDYHTWWQSYGYYYTGLVILYYTPNACHYLDDMWMDDNWQGGAYGHTICQWSINDEYDGLLCLQSLVSINKGMHEYIAQTLSWNYHDAAYGTWCHEIGHTYGIAHDYWPNSCTSAPMLPNQATTYSNQEYSLMSSLIPIYGPWL